MSGDHQLGLMINQAMNQGEHAQLALWRKRRLGLVQQVNSVALKPVLEQREECFAVRLPVQRAAAVSSFDPEPIDFRRHVVEALGSKKKAVAGMQYSALKANKVLKVRMRVFRRKIEILAATLGVESIFRSNCFEQSGFSRAVFSDEEGHSRMKFQPVQMPDCRNAEWVRLK